METGRSIDGSGPCGAGAAWALARCLLGLEKKLGGAGFGCKVPAKSRVGRRMWHVGQRLPAVEKRGERVAHTVTAGWWGRRGEGGGKGDVGGSADEGTQASRGLPVNPRLMAWMGWITWHRQKGEKKAR